MFSYASKRIIRGRGLSLALFLSVVLAATLFSGILQGADAVGGSALDNMLDKSDWDVIDTNIYSKNTTETHIYDIDELLPEPRRRRVRRPLHQAGHRAELDEDKRHSARHDYRPSLKW